MDGTALLASGTRKAVQKISSDLDSRTATVSLVHVHKSAGYSMVLFENAFLKVSQGFFSGWRIENRLEGVILVPNWLMTERIGLVWIQVRRTKKSMSINSHFSEQLMFESFALGVVRPSLSEGKFWAENTPDAIADTIILSANTQLRARMDP